MLLQNRPINIFYLLNALFWLAFFEYEYKICIENILFNRQGPLHDDRWWQLEIITIDTAYRFDRVVLSIWRVDIFVLLSLIGEWVMEGGTEGGREGGLLTPNERLLFSYIMARTSYIRWPDNRYDFVLERELDLYWASWLNQQVVGRYVAALGHIILFTSQTVVALST